MPRKGMLAVNIRGLGRIQNTLGNMPKKLEKELSKTIRKIAIVEIETKAKLKLTRDGHVDTGRLRTSIHTEYEGTRRILPGRLEGPLGVIVGTNVEYAIYVERIDSYLIWAFKKAHPILIREVQNAIRRALS